MVEYVLKAFTSNDLISLVNAELKAAGNRTRVNELIKRISKRIPMYLFRSKRGALYVVMFVNKEESQLQVRSVLKVVNKKQPFKWRVDGKVGANTSEVLWLEDNQSQVMFAGENQFKRYYRQLLGKSPLAKGEGLTDLIDSCLIREKKLSPMQAENWVQEPLVA